MTLVLDWLAREGHLLVTWWLSITLAGAAALPLCLRLCGALPDGGYTIARAVGLLFVTWLFWLLGSYGFLDNSLGSIIICWLLVLSAALASCFCEAEAGALASWWRENRGLVVVTEVLFALLFFGWALYRAHQNGLTGTEKPMELAFMSAAQRSASFPPDDPWMSGFAISYYYMGYIMSAGLATISGVTSTVGFNLTNASLFSLTGIAAFGVAYNLARSRSLNLRATILQSRKARLSASAVGLLAALILTLMGNFQFALIEAPLQTRSAPQSYLEFWDTQKLPDFEAVAYEREPSASLLLNTSNWSHWWWFNASRAPTDHNLDNHPTVIQPIGEFPAFSFLLSDNHPHVLALPFVVSVIGLMLNLLLTRHAPSTKETLVYGIAIGGLAFLNAWDGPTFLAGLIGAEALRRLMTSESGRLTARDWLETARFGVALVLIAAVAYLPYLVGFRSQAGGILPNLLHPSKLRHFFVMFGPLLVILTAYLVVEGWRGQRAFRLNWRLGLTVGLGVLAILLLLMAGMGALLALANPGQAFIGNLSGSDLESADLAQQLAQRRIQNGLTTVVLLSGIALVVARLFPAGRQARQLGEVAIDWIKYPQATGFALLLIGMGLGLTLFSEFFYLKDNFFVRINTVFKLYYQAWALWSIASAYAIYSLLSDNSLPKPHIVLRISLAAGIGLAILAGLMYTAVGVNHRALIETGRHSAAQSRRVSPPASWTDPIRHVYDGESVDKGTVLYSRISLADAAESDRLRADATGLAFFAGSDIIISARLSLDGAEGLINSDDQSVINCLRDAVGRKNAVAVEAVGQAYNVAYGRVGALSGIPILLGWENHERQWRGATYADIAGSRAADLRELYTRNDFSEVRAIIERYDITHILYGSTERQAYGGSGEEKFLDNLPVQCEAGAARVFYAGA